MSNEWHDSYDVAEGHTTENGQTPAPRILDAPERDTSDPEPFIQDLSAATPFFEARGEVQVHIGPKLHTFHVRTVPHDLLHKAAIVSKPKMPKVRDRFGAFVDDQETLIYQQWDQNYAYFKVLLGLIDVRFRDRNNQVVWTATPQQDDAAQFSLANMALPQEKQQWAQKIRRSIQALKDMRITIGHVNAILLAIDDLSKAEQAHVEEDAERLTGEFSAD